MGALISCCCPDDNDSQRRGLLDGGGQGKTYDANQQTTGNVPSYMAQETAPNPRSARQHAPSDETKKKDFLTSLQMVEGINIEDLPSKLSRLEKSLKDHAKLYNDQFENFEDLRSTLDKFKDHFAAETAGIPDIKSCLDILADRCGEAKLQATRPSKFSVEIVYDRREVSEHCQGLPEDVLEQLELYNKMNKLIRSLLEKIPTVQKSLKLVMEQEDEHLKSVIKECSTDDGPDALRRVKEQLNRLRRAPVHLETIKKYTEHIWNDILQGSKALCLDDTQKEEKRKKKKEKERQKKERERPQEVES